MNSELGIQNSELFARVLRGDIANVPPIWLMRQAGRYHAHYQRLRAKHGFDELCRTPELSAEVAMGPILDFDFDAAILFSDLLYPLEALGFGLSYDDGPPTLDGSLTFDRLARFRPQADAVARLDFQRQAMALTRARLSPDKGLIGFVGGPWTLFVYAVQGTHVGALASEAGLDAIATLYRAFADRMVPLLIDNIRLQFAGGADVVMVFDTVAGEVAPEQFQSLTGPDLAAMANAFPQQLGYYAKGRRQQLLNAREWAGFGYDAEWNLSERLRGPHAGFVQGNFDQTLLRSATRAELDRALDQFLAPLQAMTADQRRGWVCGLGHGVLPGTPEDNVRQFVTRVRGAFQ